MKLTDDAIEKLRSIICDASDAVMEIYTSGDFGVQKKEDKSVLTRADLKASGIIEKGLKRVFPDIPVLGEEGDHRDDAQRQRWNVFWAVDPIDGTKEFVEQNDQFVINIALIVDANPVFGIMIHPPSGVMYWGGKEYGAWKASGMKPPERLKNTANIDHTESKRLRILINQKRSYPLDTRFVDFLHKKGFAVDVDYVGSAWKFCKLAEGVADCYPRFRGSMWRDIAAGQALAEGLGLITVPLETATDQGNSPVSFGPAKPMRYENATMLNSSFITISPDLYEEWVGDEF